MTTTSINNSTLFIHYIVVLKKTFTDTKVILFHFLLSALNRFRNHRVLNHLAFLEAHAVHNLRDTFRAKETHQIILKRNEEYRRTWVTLTTSTTAQLTVDTTALVAFCTDNSKTTCSFHLWCKFNVGTTTSHVSSNSYSTRTTCLCYDISLFLVKFSIQYVM